MPDSVIGSCQVDKDGAGLLFRFECILNALREQSDLIQGGPFASKTRLFPWEQRVNKRFNAGVDKSLENLVGLGLELVNPNTKQGDRTIALWILYRFRRLWDRYYQRSSPDLRNFEVVQAGSHVAEIFSPLQHGLLAPDKWNQVPSFAWL